MFMFPQTNQKLYLLLIFTLYYKHLEIINSLENKDVASDVGVNFKNIWVLSIESSLLHLFHYTFLQTKHQRKGY